MCEYEKDYDTDICSCSDDSSSEYELDLNEKRNTRLDDIHNT